MNKNYRLLSQSNPFATLSRFPNLKQQNILQHTDFIESYHPEKKLFIYLFIYLFGNTRTLEEIENAFCAKRASAATIIIRIRDPDHPTVIGQLTPSSRWAVDLKILSHDTTTVHSLLTGQRSAAHVRWRDVTIIRSLIRGLHSSAVCMQIIWCIFEYYSSAATSPDMTYSNRSGSAGVKIAARTRSAARVFARHLVNVTSSVIINHLYTAIH